MSRVETQTCDNTLDKKNENLLNRKMYFYEIFCW